MRKIVTGVLVLVVVASAACWQTTDEDLWREFKWITDGQIADELAGLPPPGGVESWDRHWQERIRDTRKRPVDADRMIQYMLDTREEARGAALDP